MATFDTNIKFTQQGINDIDHTTKRAAIFESEAKKLGAKVMVIYWMSSDPVLCLGDLQRTHGQQRRHLRKHVGRWQNSRE